VSNNSPISAPKILSEAGNTLSQRGVDYDSKGGERSMAKAVEIFKSITGIAISERDGWMFMIALKLARERQGKPKLDTYVDLGGYSGLLGECALRERAEAPSGSST
jgi:hypothetical protein